MEKKNHEKIEYLKQNLPTKEKVTGSSKSGYLRSISFLL